MQEQEQKNNTFPIGKGYLADVPELALCPENSGLIPDDEQCKALWRQYAMLDNVREHSWAVAELATALAKRAAQRGFAVNVPAVRASALLHDIAKTYTIRHGGSHSQLGASWVLYETKNPAIAQGVLLHVYWPWRIEQKSICRLPFFVIYADKRIRHNQCVSLQERFEDLLVRYGKDACSRANISLAYEQGKQMENALSAQLGWELDAYTLNSGRLVKRA